jgi:hypothetical protein
MIRPLPIFVLIASATIAAGQGSVKVEPTTLQGPRPLAKQTETSAIRDYLEAWQNLSAALDQNRPDLLNEGFVGTALAKFTATIDEQGKLGLHTRYQERSHDIKIIFYSPEGLSIQLVDNIEYDEQLLNQEKILATQPMHARYVAVLTPTEVRWKVRVLQAETQ